MAASINNSTITNTVFQFNIQEFDIQDAVIDRCNFNGEIDKASVTGSLTKCQFEKLEDNIAIEGPLQDMTVQVDLTPSSAKYVQDKDIPSKLISISTLKIDSNTVPRLSELPHKECFINTIEPDSKVSFIVQLSTDDTNPRGIIVMFYPGVSSGSTLESVIPKGYAVCDGSNGTPDLRGRFIRSAESLDDVGEHINSELVSNDDDSRERYIQLYEYNLPPHMHYFNEITLEDTVQVSGRTGSTSLTFTYKNVSSESIELNINENDENAASTYTGDSVSAPTVSYTIPSHDHSYNISVPISFTFTPTQKEDEFENKKINVEPNNYALIFIMKL